MCTITRVSSLSLCKLTAAAMISHDIFCHCAIYFFGTRLAYNMYNAFDVIVNDDHEKD